jgi:hypothetical protein
MVDTLLRWLGVRPDGIPPLLVRLRSDAGFVEGPVELEAVWLPSGRRARWTTQAAQGLCIVPWMGGEKVDLSLSHARRRARLALSDAEAADGSAREVWLRADEAVG